MGDLIDWKGTDHTLYGDGYFIIEGSGHTFCGKRYLTIEESGLTLQGRYRVHMFPL